MGFKHTVSCVLVYCCKPFDHRDGQVLSNWQYCAACCQIGTREILGFKAFFFSSIQRSGGTLLSHGHFANFIWFLSCHEMMSTFDTFTVPREIARNIL